jgi:hypothetical protein
VFVMGGDPVKFGIVASINRQGGNVTGVSFLLNVLAAKRVTRRNRLVALAAQHEIPVNPSAKLRTVRSASMSVASSRERILRTDTIEPAFAIVTFEAPEGPPPSPRFRTIQVCPKDLPAALRQGGPAENRPHGRSAAPIAHRGGSPRCSTASGVSSLP